MSAVAPLPFLREQGLTVRPEYRWTTKTGQKLRPSVMATRHLHHSLVMLWHHFMPADAQIRPNYRRYTMGRVFQEDAYVQASITALAAELASRSDLSPLQFSELVAIARYMRGNPTKVALQRRIEG